MTEQFELRLAIPSVWERIDPVREAVRKLVGVFADEELQDALSMVSAELLENAVKYGKPSSDLRLSVGVSSGSIVIEATNEVEPGSAHVHSLEERIRWLQAFGDPLEAYTAALERIYTGDGTTGSGLGIVRIAYEGGCEVRCDTSEPSRVTVTARSRRTLTGGTPT